MILNAADLFAAIKLRRKLVAVIAGTIFVVIALIAFLQPREYEATSSLLVDISQTDPTDETKIQSQSVTDTVMNTEMNVVRSNLVIEDVARRAGLVSTDGAAEDQGKNLQEAIKHLRDNLTVANDRQSNVISITYADSSPEQSAKIANMVSDVFLAKQVQVKAASSRETAQWFDKRAIDARNKYAAAQKKLSDFQRAHGIIGVDRMDLEAEKLKALSTALVTAEADAADARSKAGSVNMPEVAVSDAVQGLEQRRAVEAARLADLAKSLGPNHPQMAAARANLDSLNSALSSARSTQAEALSGASSAAVRREGDLRSRMAAQQQLMIRLSTVQDELMVMQRDVDSAQKTYEAVRSRLDSETLKSEIAQTNASRLDKASVPVVPSKPRLMLWLVAGVILGLLAGIASALMLEIIKPRVRTVQGLQDATDTDVLADLSMDVPGTAKGYPGIATA